MTHSCHWSLGETGEGGERKIEDREREVTCCSLKILLQLGRPAYFMFVEPPLAIISCKLSSPVMKVLRDIL